MEVARRKENLVDSWEFELPDEVVEFDVEDVFGSFISTAWVGGEQRFDPQVWHEQPSREDVESFYMMQRSISLVAGE